MASSNQFPTIENRLLCRANILPGDDCIYWVGSSRGRYGIIYHNGKYNSTHRVMYKLAHGDIPHGMVVHHTCHHSNCINPSHLELSGHKEHTLGHDGPTAINKAKTHCRHGHPYDEKNTRYSAKGRECRACARDRYHRDSEEINTRKRELRRRAGKEGG